eukprot:CAMPEP_0172768436 /NCGR_PEP_ID=MMETSP1074-20121228/184745_1 /TAXON_ID=2916 /ORGANISM="Ceratium fusus, Strain PA161109" /LENGTH=173 /DNA_ID=CAMNT_0013603837 /DNA_START=1 /DNA_END=519 /DNA_ORIENTATION=-
MTMEGMVQKHYMHRVPKEDNIEGPRINLTWRWVVRHRPRCPATRARSRFVSDQSNVVSGSGTASNQPPYGPRQPIAPPHDGVVPAKQRPPITVPPPAMPPPPPPPNVPKAQGALHPEPSQPGSKDGDGDWDPKEQMTSPKSSLFPPARPNLLRQVSSAVEAGVIEAPQSKLGM